MAHPVGWCGGLDGTWGGDGVSYPEYTALHPSGPAACGVLYGAWRWRQAELSEESLSPPITITWASHFSSWRLGGLVCKMGIRFHSPHRGAEESSKKTVTSI